jgi:hypothetical protein
MVWHTNAEGFEIQVLYLNLSRVEVQRVIQTGFESVPPED